MIQVVSQLPRELRAEAYSRGLDPRQLLRTLRGRETLSALGHSMGIALAPGSGLLTRNPLTIVKSVPVVEWWRADLGITIGTGVAAWAGQKAGLVWSQGTAANQPTYLTPDSTLNGRPALVFDGVNDEMAGAFAAPAPGTTPRFYWIVARDIAFAVSSCLIAGAAGNSHLIYRGAGDAANQLSLFNLAKLTGTANFPTGNGRLIQASLTNSTADFLKLGSALVTGTNCLNGSAASMYIGSFGGSGFANVAIAEILITQGAPAAAELAALEGYSVGIYGSAVMT